MDLPTLDYASARDHMVDSQIRPDRVVDPRLIRAMRTLPRERFVPAAQASMAYIDEDVRLPGGRVLMEPRVLAHLVQLARVRLGERVLVIGAGTGYGAAVFEACGAAGDGARGRRGAAVDRAGGVAVGGAEGGVAGGQAAGWAAGSVGCDPDRRGGERDPGADRGDARPSGRAVGDGVGAERRGWAKGCWPSRSTRGRRR